METRLREPPRGVVGRRPEDARDESRRLADEEHDDDADQHHGRVVPSPQHDDADGTGAAADLAPPPPPPPRVPTARRPHGTDEKRVEDGERDERHAVDEGDVQPRVVELAKETRLAEGRQVAPDSGGAAAVTTAAQGERQRMDEANGPVLEELGDVVGDAGDSKTEDHFPRSTDRAEELRMERMADDDVPGMWSNDINSDITIYRPMLYMTGGRGMGRFSSVHQWSRTTHTIGVGKLVYCPSNLEIENFWVEWSSPKRLS